jgi:hypothetical protein
MFAKHNILLVMKAFAKNFNHTHNDVMRHQYDLPTQVS